VLLDWDNTLHDSAGMNFDALRRVLEPHGIAVTPNEYRRAYTVDYRALYRRLGLRDELIDDASARWRRIVADAEPRLLPGVVEALDRLEAAGCRLGLITTGPRVVVEPQLRHLALSDRFATIAYGGDQPPRPDPAPLLAAVAALDASPHATAFCSDTTADMRMAKRAGVQAVGIASFAHDAPALERAGADETAPSVAAWVERLLGSAPPH
jgi:phosphoglycolate phosphatase